MAATGAEGLVGAEGVSITKINRNKFISLDSVCYVLTTNLKLTKVENTSQHKATKMELKGALSRYLAN